MKHEVVSRRRAANITLPPEMIAEARELEINLSKACEAGLKRVLKAERDRRWQVTHQERVDAFTTWFEENGLPFADIRV